MSWRWFRREESVRARAARQTCELLVRALNVGLPDAPISAELSDHWFTFYRYGESWFACSKTNVDEHVSAHGIDATIAWLRREIYRDAMLGAELTEWLQSHAPEAKS